MENNYQRPGSISNAHVGRDFEERARQIYFDRTRIMLEPNFSVPIGTSGMKKPHNFDMGSEKPPILVECKSYTWTSGGNSPSAKIRALNEVMLFFSLAPRRYKKMLFVLKHLRKDVSLATHYIKTQGHLIGRNIEIWEFDLDNNDCARVFPNSN
ncbi:MAG: hypothetical protein ICV60_12815 [Pyrinomonadaceae bacterium]|nr:hypothetical protein [Pyrinomonadaceae bacterium]